MTERCRLCDEPAEIMDLCFQCEDKTLANFLNQHRRFTIECRRTGIQPFPGLTWSGDSAQRSLARLRALPRFRNHDLQLIEVPESSR